MALRCRLTVVKSLVARRHVIIVSLVTSSCHFCFFVFFFYDDDVDGDDACVTFLIY